MANLVFQGASALALDAKGRFSVPARHRDALVAPAPEGAGGQLTLTKHPEGCLLVFPRPHWESFREDLMALKGDGQWWKRIFLGNAVDVELDNASRVLVSPELRAGAGLDKDVMLLGLGTHLELWDAATYAAKEAMAMRQGMPEALKSLSF